MFDKVNVILGVPIDNLDMNETVDKILEMIEEFKKDRRARLVATVNVDFLVNSLGWAIGKVRHPELLDILRRSDLVTPDGMPVVWLSRLLTKKGLKERVTGADLVPELAKACAKAGKKIFMLGGKGDVGQQAADILLKDNPNLKFAGISSPFVYVEGEALLGAEEEDLPILEEINSSGADILLIAFGNPKQEVWFERNRYKLKVPVSIGIGGTFEFITGSVSRAPVWMQRSGLEWIYRMTQDPKRLWKRYFIGFLKLGMMTLPLLTRHFFSKGIEKEESNLPTCTNNKFALTFKFPKVVNSVNVEKTHSMIYEKVMGDATNVIVDLSDVEYFDVSGLGMFMSLRRQVKARKKEFFIIGLNEKVKGSFLVNRIWDTLEREVLANENDVFKKLKEKGSMPGFYFLITMKDGFGVVKLVGRLDSFYASEFNYESFVEKLGNKNYIFDMEELDFVDSTGLGTILKIYKHFARNNQKMVLCSLNEGVTQLLKITKLIKVFKITDNLNTAEKKINS
ncbi:MAG: STAS domain-containing protein [Calditrichaeota bacterium]|nr:MAG: STAS domain-containing protein [Calditrichota bacterium]